MGCLTISLILVLVVWKIKAQGKGKAGPTLIVHGKRFGGLEYYACKFSPSACAQLPHSLAYQDSPIPSLFFPFYYFQHEDKL